MSLHPASKTIDQAETEQDRVPSDPLQLLLQKATGHAAQPAPAGALILGEIVSLNAAGLPRLHVDGVGLVDMAASLVPITVADVGKTVAFSMPVGPASPGVVLGLVWQPQVAAMEAVAPQPLEASVDGNMVHIEARQSIKLSCGRASITLTADGQILLRGDYISNHSTGTQRIKGAAVQIN
ncbi:hypothetical protein FNU76_14770 [Chitinimonas arctica]|uniref:Gp5/Type VI secretion system Vgr protein OB-fold domain-containing protein n=1 Tax=Chitinimonas arctica TaxID=2594795 RepID=A0A516SH79_9NEIS|nr:hypothetical protein [Chitinimonas arctica]QDQ27517.1 hypothetical protein FNU76_14770 [Chitinimonas arctica]